MNRFENTPDWFKDSIVFYYDPTLSKEERKEINELCIKNSGSLLSFYNKKSIWNKIKLLFYKLKLWIKKIMFPSMWQSC